MNLQKRLAEIEARKKEIRAVLECDRELSLDELDKFERELRDLNSEKEEIEQRLRMAEGLNNGSIEGRVVDSTRGTAGGGVPSWLPGARTAAGAWGGLSFRSLFPNVPMTDGGFRSFHEWWQAVVSTRHDPRLFEQRTHMAGVPELGGYLVPVQYVAAIIDAVLQESIILPRARVIPLESLKAAVPAWDDLDQSTGTYYGGFKPTWIGEDEDQSGNEQTTKLRQVTLQANKLALYTSLTREVAFGSRPSLEQELRSALATSVQLGLDEAFLLGDGEGKPVGIATDKNPALVTVNRAEAGKVTYADLAAMLGRLHGSAMAGAIWIANPEVLPELLTMTDPAGRLIWQPSAREGEPDRLLGKPIYFFDRLPALGEKADIVLCNPRFYIVGLGPAIAVEASTGPHWFKDRLALRAITLADGKSAWDKPYTPPSGAQRSWAVALDAPEA